MIMENEIEKLYIRCHLLFDNINGHLIRKTKQAPNAKLGEEAGFIDYSLSKSGSGYRRLKINSKSYLTHRIIFLMEYKELPICIDHVNGNTLDNRICNLRSATKLQNRWNCKGNTGSNTGIKGVYEDGSKFKALINVDGKRYYLGMYVNKEEAGEVVRLKYLELQGNFTFKGEQIMEQTKVE
jgi:hypothetical protein